MRSVLSWFGLLVGVVVLFVAVAPVTAQTTSLTRAVAVLALIGDDGAMTLHVDLGNADAMTQPWPVPTGAQIRELADSPLPVMVETMQLPVRSKDYLLLNGEPTPVPMPTLTPYIRRDIVPFMLGERSADVVQVVIPADVNSNGHRFVEVSCLQCDAGWEQFVLAQLPADAPIVVVAPFIAEIAGAWRIKAQPATADGRFDAGAMYRATLFERQSATPVGAIMRTDLRQVSDTHREKFRYIYGRSRLLRVVLCLVAVLFMSVSSFYLSIAVMRRMHAAVGYNPNEGK
jgi:hypothetical protein